MFSIRFMLGAAVGAAAGYSVSRALEARAHGVPLRDAFSTNNLLTPIHKLWVKGYGDRPNPGDAWANLTPVQRDQLDAYERSGKPFPSLRPA